MANTYPQFICIGAQKAGTTWLYACLKKHPGVAMPPVKEVHYFDSLSVKSFSKFNTKRFRRAKKRIMKHNEDKNPVPPRMKWLAQQRGKKLDDAWYAKVYEGAPANALRVDITPSYTLLPDEGVEHVLKLCPDAKILLMLRDPVDRSFSQVRMRIAARKLPQDAQTMLKFAQKKNNLKRSRYMDVLERWYARVPPERLKIVFYDDITTRPMELLEEICKFAGLEFKPSYFPESKKVVHEGKKMELPSEVKSYLVQEHLPTIRALAQKFPQAKSWLQKYER
jgi:hypothetical protein